MFGNATRYSLNCLFCIGLAFTQAAGAQDAPVSDLTGLSIEELSRVRLSTASRHLDDPRKAPAAVTVITADEISRQGWRTLAIFAAEPAVAIARVIGMHGIAARAIDVDLAEFQFAG